MSGFTLFDLRAAICAQLRENLAEEYTVDPYNQSTAGKVIGLELAESDPIDYWGTFGPQGLGEVLFDMVINMGAADESALIRLDRLLSAGLGNGSSLVDAVFTDPTFGGACTAATSFEVTEYNAGTATAVCRLGVHVAKQGAEA